MPAADFPLHTLEPLVRLATGVEPPLEFSEIFGGASVRRFFRVKAGPGSSLIAMYVPAQSHELSKPPSKPRRWPFLEVRELLEERGVRVPKLLAEDCANGWILVEDLGDTLAQHLNKHPEERDRLYSAAVRSLSLAQRALRELPEHSVILERAFDEDLLTWELHHFREFGLEARGISLNPRQAEVFERAVAHIASTIAAWPRGFVHRDYQSRNIMVVEPHQPELGWIDFQDAMLGPRVYDMVALLNDSYQNFDVAFVSTRLDEFGAALGLAALEREALKREFAWVTVQRKLKDAGRFIFIERRHDNPSFLPFFEPTLRKAYAALRSLNDGCLGDLGDLLVELFPMLNDLDVRR
ncbi:MAG TPA: phosphotransferase [Polyangiaceae bacterium]|nr:phosphotransferase [Polyangiaceae bacterium]